MNIGIGLNNIHSKEIKEFFRHLIRFYNNISIKVKLVFSSFLLVVLPIAIFSGIFLSKAVQMAKKHTEDSILMSLSQTASNIESLLESYAELSNDIIFDENIASRLFKNNTPKEIIDLYNYWWTRRGDIMKLRPDILDITLYTNNSSLPDAPPYLMDLEKIIKLQPEFKQFINSDQNVYWGGTRSVPKLREYWYSDNQHDNTSRKKVISFNRKYYYNNTNNLAVLTMGISVQSIYGLIEKDGINKDIMIFDSYGKLVASSNKLYDGKEAAQIFPNIDLLKYDKAILKVTKNSRIFIHKLSNNWRLVVVLSLADIRSEASRLLLYGIIIIIIISIFASGMMFIIAELLTRRINLLLNKFKHFDHSSLDPGPTIEGDDEIGMLDKSFQEMARNLKQYIDRTYVLQLQRKKIEIELLQAQINPHFLYNALSAIEWMTESRSPEDVRKALNDLSMFYRIRLSRGKEIISIEDELIGLKSYMEIMKLRSPDRIRIFYDIDDVILSAAIPKMTLQPIVENCIEHGFSATKPIVNIIVTGKVCGNDVVIQVIDDGAGIPKDKLVEIQRGNYTNNKKGGYGLRNVDLRLKMYFGDEYGLKIDSVLDEGTTVTIKLPFKEAIKN